MDFSKCRRIGRLVGHGYAVRCMDGRICKFKAKAVKVVYGVLGPEVTGIELDMPSYVRNQFPKSFFVKDGDHYWMHPVFLYRNKGDCARAEAKERLSELESRLLEAEQGAKSHADMAKSMERRAAEAKDKLDKAGEEFRKMKWWREAAK